MNPANVRQSHFETGATVIIGISSGGGEDRESTLQIIRRGGLVHDREDVLRGYVDDYIRMTGKQEVIPNQKLVVGSRDLSVHLLV